MVEEFKNELKNYESYKESLKELNDSLSVLWYKVAGVTAIQYDKQPGNRDERAAAKRKHEQLEKIAKIENEIQRKELQIVYIDNVLNEIENKEALEAIKNIFFEKKTYRKVAEQHYMSHVALYNLVNKELERAIRRTHEL